MSNVLEKIIKTINEEKVEMLYLCFVDFKGQLRTKGIFTYELLKNYEGFFKDGVSVTVNLFDEKSQKSDFFLLKPITSSFKVIDFIESDIKSAFILCDIINSNLDSRKYIHKVSEIMSKNNYLPMCGMGLTYTIESDDIAYAGNGNHMLLPSSKFNQFSLQLSKILINLGIDIEYYIPGSLRHNHLAFVTKDLITTVDNDTISRWIASTYAIDNNISINFSKPFERVAPIHISLWDLEMKNNLFYDSNDRYEFSKIGRYFVGGILCYFDEIFAVIIGSSKKLPEENYVCKFSYEDDNSVISTPCYYVENEKMSRAGWSKRCLFRGILPETNMYLTLSSIYMAGLIGIKEKIEYEKYIDEKHTVNSLSIEEKINKLERCQPFVELFGNDIIGKLIENLKSL